LMGEGTSRFAEGFPTERSPEMPESPDLQTQYPTGKLPLERIRKEGVSWVSGMLEEGVQEFRSSESPYYSNWGI
jgi:hypothetical protein